MNKAIINNPLTDKTVQNHFSKQSFLEMVNFWTNDKSVANPLVTAQSLGISSRSGDPETWTPIIWELDGNKDIAEQQSKIIVNMIANPNYVFEKSQGAGRPPTKNIIIGTREVHFGNHFDAGNNHLHTLSFNYSTAPNGTVNNQDNWARRSEAKSAFINALNETLNNAGLPKINSFMLNMKQTNDTKVSETQKIQTETAITEKKTYEEYKVDISHTEQVNPVAVNDEFNRLKVEFDLVEKEQKQRLQALQQLKEANEVVLKYNHLVEEVKKQNTQIAELETVKEFTAELIEENKTEISTLKSKLTDLETELTETKETSQTEFNNLWAEKERAEKIIEEKEQTIIDKERDIGALQILYNEEVNDLEDTKRVVEQYKEVTAKQEEEIKKINAENTRFQSMFETLEKQMARMNVELEKQQAIIKEQTDKQLELQKENIETKATLKPALEKIEFLSMSNEDLKAKTIILEISNKALIESNNAYQSFVETVKEQGQKFIKACKDLVTAKPALKKDITPLIKEQTAIVKEEKKLTDGQKKIMEIMRRKELENQQANIVDNTNSNSDTNQIKPK